MWKKWFGRNKSLPENAAEAKLDSDRLPRHIAIIMDGNGRWAQKRGLPRTFGHRAGVEALRDIVKAASNLGIGVLTTYAFSTENWKRPSEEVNLLMSLFSEYLDNEIAELHERAIRVRFIGKIDELADSLQNKIDYAQKLTANNKGMVLNIAVNYGSRAEIVNAVQIIARKIANHELAVSEVSEKTIDNYLYTAGLPDPDLLIRPSGDQRISNYLLWQLAYTELWFTPVNWPDFKPDHLVEAIVNYQQRERRFGGLKQSK
jgi:undecaprenyl diphosphate synthase